MTRELVSKRTRNEFREFLVGWTLREIEIEFEGANIGYDRDYEPDVSGQRRSFVEQYYHTLDFAKPADVRRLLLAYQSIVERAEGNLPAGHGREKPERSIAQLKTCLARDGFAYGDGTITAKTPQTCVIFEPQRAITEITRRTVFDELIVAKVVWSGELTEREFLGRVFDLASLPSHDPCFDSMSEDIWKHREANLDWDDDWVLTDGRLDLLGTEDEVFLRFLCQIVHPVVRPNSNDARTLVLEFNNHLVVDGWELVEGKPISGRPTFVARRRASGAVALPDPILATDVLSDEYVRELSGKCDARLASEDLDGAVTVARTLLEAVLSELEARLAGARGNYKGNLPKQFKKVTKLLRMDEQRPDLDDRFKDVIRGLVMVANGLAPLRNKMSDGHARERKPAPHHAHVVVNAAKTVSVFLVESYTYQIAKGLIHETSPAVKEGSA